MGDHRSERVMPETHEHRITRLEKDMDAVCTDIKLILTNHLPHIQNEIAVLNTTIKIFGGLILSGITALILLGLTP